MPALKNKLTIIKIKRWHKDNTTQSLIVGRYIYGYRQQPTVANGGRVLVGHGLIPRRV